MQIRKDELKLYPRNGTYTQITSNAEFFDGLDQVIINQRVGQLILQKPSPCYAGKSKKVNHLLSNWVNISYNEALPEGAYEFEYIDDYTIAIKI